MNKIRLEPFTEEDFDNLISWISNGEELFQFAGPYFSYPLDKTQLKAYLKRKDRKPFKVVLSDTKESIGHCELNYENQGQRLSRVLIGKSENRGKGLGVEIVKEMCRLFYEDPDLMQVDLNVFSWNKAAIKCYEKAGFKINPAKSDEFIVNGNTWVRLNMVHQRTKS